MVSDTARVSLDRVFREERGRLLATLVRRYGDLDFAEDVTQDAIEAALQHWPVGGVPTKPGAWLLTTARRRAVDRLRRDRTYAARLALMQVDLDRTGPAAPQCGVDPQISDERLHLFFTCTHPALHADDRMAITLRCLAGFTTAEVARALLISPTTAGQRISRAKKKIRSARIPFRAPDRDELPARLPGVLQVLYSVFTEGHAASSGANLVRRELAEEAIRLARILRSSFPAEREAAGLLALMLLTHARHAARVGASGELRLLDEQDRALWDRDMIDEGSALVVPSLSGGGPGPYGLQAAIAALHAEAVTPNDTDWAQIVELYRVLDRISPSPVVTLGHAVAVAMRDGPRAGLAMLDTVGDDPVLLAYHPYFTARGDLNHRLGRYEEAAADFRRAGDLAGSEPERQYLAQRAAVADDLSGSRRRSSRSGPTASTAN